MKHIDDLDLVVLLQEYDDNDQEHDDLECVEEGDWINEGKYQYLTRVYKHKPTGRFVAIDQNRSGSYFSDFEYGDASICEVKPVTKTITVYEAV